MLARIVDKNVEMDGITGTTNSDPIDVSGCSTLSVQTIADVNTPSAVTFDSNTYERNTLTFETMADTDHQDYFIVTSVSGLTFAVALTKPVAEVQTLTFPDKATAANGDYIVVEDTVGTQYAVALTKPVSEVQTITFPTVAGSTGGDYIVITDGSGLTWAISLDKSGADAEPTGAAWLAVDAARKVHVNISGGTDEASVAALVETAFDALAGVGAAIVTDDTAANGTMTFTMQVKAPCADPVPHDAGDIGAGSISGVETTAGVAAQTPTGALWVAADQKGLADISGDTTAAQVAARAETALNALTGFTAAITTDDSAANGTMTLTQGLKAPVVNPVPKSFDDGTAGTITGVQSTGGVASEAPAGALYTAVSASRKGLADISGDTTAAQVAARVETALNALTGFTALVTTDDSAANGTMTLTQTAIGPVANVVPKNADDSGAGGISVAETIPGRTTELDLTSEEVSVPSHGLFTGLKGQLTTSGTLPTGLSLATDYFIIAVDANTVSFATSLANALAGTAIDLTGEGTGQHTFTATSLAGATVKLQKSNAPYSELSSDAVWTDVQAAENVTADETNWFEYPNATITALTFKWVRISYTLTAGSMSTNNHVLAKG